MAELVGALLILGGRSRPPGLGGWASQAGPRYLALRQADSFLAALTDLMCATTWLPDFTTPPGASLPCKNTAADVSGGIERLIGRPRARLLRALNTPASTSQLSRQLGMSLGGTSTHLAILLQVGLGHQPGPSAAPSCTAAPRSATRWRPAILSGIRYRNPPTAKVLVSAISSPCPIGRPWPSDTVKPHHRRFPGMPDRHPGAGCRRRRASGGFLSSSSLPVSAFLAWVSLLAG